MKLELALAEGGDLMRDSRNLSVRNLLRSIEYASECLSQSHRRPTSSRAVFCNYRDPFHPLCQQCSKLQRREESSRWAKSNKSRRAVMRPAREGRLKRGHVRVRRQFRSLLPAGGRGSGWQPSWSSPIPHPPPQTRKKNTSKKTAQGASSFIPLPLFVSSQVCIASAWCYSAFRIHCCLFNLLLTGIFAYSDTGNSNSLLTLSSISTPT